MNMAIITARHRCLALCLAILVTCFCSGVSMAAAPAASGKTGNPADFLGVWIGAGFGSTAWRNTPWKMPPEFTPWGAAESRRLADPQETYDTCEPTGPVAIMGANPLFPLQIAGSPGELIMAMEGSPILRHIYIDGRPHPDFLEPDWMGHSIGHWEGDVLVVDTIGLKASKRPLNGFVSNAVIPMPSDHDARIPVSDQLHVIERIRLVGDGQFLENEITVEDPKVYTKPLVTKVYSQRRPDLYLLEYYCNENPRPDEEGYIPPKASATP